MLLRRARLVQDVDNVHELHKQDTTTTFGIHRTVKPSSCSTAKGNDKPKVKVLSETTELHNYNQVMLQLLQKSFPYTLFSLEGSSHLEI